MDKWLEEWKEAYNEGVDAKIADVEGLRPAQAFVQTIQTFDPTWADSIRETYNVMGLPLPDLHTLVERYQQKTRIYAVQNTKRANVNAAFATLQGLSPKETKHDSETQGSLSRSSSKQRRQCLCKKWHDFKNCVYFIESIRPANWKPDAMIQAAIDETLQRVPQLKRAVEHAQAFRAEEARKGKGKAADIASSSSPKDNGLSDGAFAISGLSTAGVVDSEAERNYQDTMRNAWMFDIGSNIHVCNSLKGFTKTRDSDETIRAGAIPLAIQTYGQVIIEVAGPNGMKLLVLYDVAYIPGFFTNLVSAK